MMEELDFIFGLQITQTNDDIFINQSIYIKDLLKRFRMERVKETDTPIRSSTKLDMDKNGKNIDITKLNITITIYLKHYKITKKKITTILVNYMNRLTVLAVSTKLERDSKHIWYTSYSKSKNISKSSILNHTLICAIKPSYCITWVFNLIPTTFKHFKSYKCYLMRYSNIKTFNYITQFIKRVSCDYKHVRVR